MDAYVTANHPSAFTVLNQNYKVWQYIASIYFSLCILCKNFALFLQSIKNWHKANCIQRKYTHFSNIFACLLFAI